LLWATIFLVVVGVLGGVGSQQSYHYCALCYSFLGGLVGRWRKQSIENIFNLKNLYSYQKDWYGSYNLKILMAMRGRLV
jgi:hypothetical protein